MFFLIESVKHLGRYFSSFFFRKKKTAEEAQKNSSPSSFVIKAREI